MIADDLFAGAGGWDLAAEALGVQARGVENMPAARATRDAAGLTTIHDDVWTFAPDGSASGLIASPPCQSFSTAGKGSGRKALDSVLAEIQSGAYLDLNWLHALGEEYGDERTALVLTPLHFALTGGYEWLAWEQVPGVLPVWEACAEVLRAQGWHVWTGKLYAEQYGVPQTRTRAFLLASRHHEVAPPTPTHSRYYSRSPEKLDEGVAKWISMAEGLGWSLLERPAFTITGGSAHAASGIEWGGASTRKQLLDSVGDTEAWREKSWAFDCPAPTVAADPRLASRGCKHPREGCCSQWSGTPGRQFGADAIRVTPAEAGVLQAFPADFPWQGTKGKQFLQAGNAVPPLMAAAALGSVVPNAREVAA